MLPRPPDALRQRPPLRPAPLPAALDRGYAAATAAIVREGVGLDGMASSLRGFPQLLTEVTPLQPLPLCVRAWGSMAWRVLDARRASARDARSLVVSASTDARRASERDARSLVVSASTCLSFLQALS